MKTLITCLSLVFTCLAAHGDEHKFEDILARVTQRDPITEAILNVDNRLLFDLNIEGDKANVSLFRRSRRIGRRDIETYEFPASDIARQEYDRIQFQKEKDELLKRCTESERRFRISQYKLHPIRFGMPYEEAKKVLKDEFIPDESLTGFTFVKPVIGMAEYYRINSDAYSIIFRYGVLIDIVKKEDLQQDSAEQPTTAPKSIPEDENKPQPESEPAPQ